MSRKSRLDSILRFAEMNALISMIYLSLKVISVNLLAVVYCYFATFPFCQMIPRHRFSSPTGHSQEHLNTTLRYKTFSLISCALHSKLPPGS